MSTRFFIKRHPTFQLEFESIFASDADRRSLQVLSAEELQWVIDYCRYRLDIYTQLKTQVELEGCQKR